MSEKVILVISMDGYPKHDLPERVDDLFHQHEKGQEWRFHGHGRHQYFYNSEGYQLVYFTNFSIPEETPEYNVFSGIWDLEIKTEGNADDHEFILEKPIEFEVNGQKYLYLGNIWGYSYDSKSPDDERYEA